MCEHLLHEPLPPPPADVDLTSVPQGSRVDLAVGHGRDESAGALLRRGLASLGDVVLPFPCPAPAAYVDGMLGGGWRSSVTPAPI